MRIGFQTDHFDPRRGGAEIYVRRLARHLVAAGHEPHIFTGDDCAPEPGIRVHLVRPYGPEAVRDAAAALRLDLVVGTGRCLGMHVFQPHGGTYLGSRRQNLALTRARWARRLRTAANRVLPKYCAARALERRQYTQKDPLPRFVAISRMVARDMQTFYEVPEDRLHLIYHGVDTSRFSPRRAVTVREETRHAWGLAPGTVCFLLVAHNLRLKGLRELIEAAALLRHRHDDFRIVVVSKGRSRGYQHLAERLGCGRHLLFVGPLADVERAYAAADVYTHPAWYDPFGLVVLEAWASGLPVITTRFTGAGELMTEGREGFLIETPADTAALAAHMAELCEPRRRGIMGRRGRTLAERHTAEENFQALMGLFQLAAAESPASSQRAA